MRGFCDILAFVGNNNSGKEETLMKLLFWGSVFFLVFFLVQADVSLAQNIRIGYVDTEKVLDSAPGADEASKIFDEEVGTWKGEAENLKGELQTLIEEYESQQLILSPEKKREKEEKIALKKNEYDQKVYEIQGKIQQRSAELSQPILEKVYQTIKVVSERENYDLVFDSSLGAIVYADPSLDITQVVIDELKKSGGQ
jgi:outer membrane protein